MPTAAMHAPTSASSTRLEPRGAPAQTFLGAVFLLGTLLTLLGSVLPVWGYHRLDAFIAAGNHFLAMAVGFILANIVVSAAVGRHARWILSPIPGSLFAIAGVVLFALLPPPYPIHWQLLGAGFLGLSLGSLMVMVFHRIGVIYRINSAAAFTLTNLFGLVGALATPLGVAIVVSSSGSVALLALAVVPLLIAVASWRKRREELQPLPTRSLREALEDFRNPPAVLLALLLFFQLGNELALLGWLPVFLIQRLGVSPSTAIYALATFVFALLVGRMGTQALGEKARRNRVLLGGIAIALLGCLMLLSTDNLFGAFLGVALAGAGFSPIYPVTMERIGKRFPYYHPGVLNSIFSVGLVGGLLAPFTLGLFASYFGIRSIMGLPIAGSLVVAVILLLTWLERRLMGSAE